MRIAERILNAIASKLGEPEEINGHNRCPTYLYRWELAAITWLGKTTRIYLHKFVGDDWALDLHDHPKRFISIGLSGRYTEWTPESVTQFRAPWFRTFPATHRHRITGPRPDETCWTLVIVGPASRVWGFWHRGEFVDWKTYVSPGSPKATIGCV